MATRSPLDSVQPIVPPGLVPASRPVPGTGFMENAGASFEEMQIAGNIGSSDRNLSEAYAPVLDALDAAGARYDGRTYRGPQRLHFLNPGDLTDDPLANPYGVDVPGRTRMRQMIFDEVRRQRQINPQFLAGVPDNADAFERQANAATRARLDRIRDVQGRATGLGEIGGFAGGVAGSFTDPVNLATLPMGGGARTLIGGIARSALENMLVELASQPIVRENYAALGEPMTFDDSVRSVLYAGGMGAAFHAGVAGVGAGYRGIRAGIARLLPEERWTPDISAAVNVAEREDELHQASPFEPGQAGDDAHVDGLTEALQRVQRETPAPPAASADVPRVSPAPRPLPTSAPVDDVTAIDDYMAHVGRHESAGHDAVDNLAGSSTAGGRFQFTDGTFRTYYRRLYGTDPGPHPAPALKHDGAIQQRLMRALTADNAAALRRGGFAVDRGNLFLLHFLGPEDGMKVLRAAGDTPVEGLVQGRSIAANPTILPHRRAGDVIAWAHRAMGGHVDPEARVAAGEPPSPEAMAAEGGGAAELADAEALAASRAAEVPEPPPPDAVPAYESAPVLRRDLFGSDAEWTIAQDRLERDFADRGGIGAPESGNGASGRETALGGAEGPAAENASEGADFAGAQSRSGEAAASALSDPDRELLEVSRDASLRLADLYRAGSDKVETYGRPPAEFIAERQAIVDRISDIMAAAPREDIPVANAGELYLRDLTHRVTGHFSTAEADQVLSVGRRIAAADGADQVTRPHLAEAASYVSLSDHMRQLAAERRQSLRGPAAAPPTVAEQLPALQHFAEPGGEGAKLQADSIEHDLRAALEADPALGDRPFAIDDGPPRKLSEILAALDSDVAAAEAIRGCL